MLGGKWGRGHPIEMGFLGQASWVSLCGWHEEYIIGRFVVNGEGKVFHAEPQFRLAFRFW